MPLAIRATLLAATCLAATALPALAQEIGTAGAVNPASTGTPPARPTRVLELGARVVHRERINTAGGGNVQLVFNDKTTMSIGPNSSVVIDEFVYDPNAGTGRLTASMAKGVLRFVGGNTSHSGGAEIKTPSATLGIRGGVATIEIVPCSSGSVSTECGTKVTNHFGILSITSGAGTEIIRRPGFVVSIPNAASTPTSPRKVTQAEVNRTNASLTSKPGQTGGAGGRASGPAVERADVAGPLIAQIGTTVASIQSQTQAREASAANTLGLAVAPTDATTPTQIRQIVDTTQQQVTAQTPQFTAAEGGNQDNPIVRPLPGVASPQAFALAYTGPQSPATLVPGATYNSPVLGYADGGTLNGRANTNARTLQAGLGISGSGASQSSTLYVVVGNSFLADGGAVSNGGFTGTQRASAAGLPTRVSGGIVATGIDVALDPQFAPTRIAGRAGSVSDQGTVTSETGSIVRYPGPATTPFGYQVGQARTEVPAGLGANRSTLDSVPNPLFGGFAAGLSTTVNNTTGAVGTTNILTGLFDLTFNPTTSQFGTTLGVNNSGNADGNALTYAYLDYGKPVGSFYSRPGTRDGRGTYVDANNFGAREATSPTGASTSEVNGSTVREHRGVFVSSDTVNAKSFFPGVNFCQCEYTRWGFWTSETTRLNASGQSLTDLTHLGTWVFGDPTLDAAMPRTGTATYTGHAIASIRNGTAEYVAAGNFQNVVNFGTGTGAASVTGLDGRNYAGTVTVGQGSNFVGGTLASSVAGSTMGLTGQFARGVSGPAGEIGGTVVVSGTAGYAASGIFAGSAPAPR